MWNACAKRDCCHLDGRQRSHNQSITRVSKKIIFIHRMHRKAALTTNSERFNFRTVDDRKDWLK